MPTAQIDPRFIQQNHGEALLWFAVAAGFAWYAYKQRGDRRRSCIIALTAFALFGLSDLVEARTGAWWRPWWLLVWKLACVAAMLWLLVREFRRRERGADAPGDEREPPADG